MKSNPLLINFAEDFAMLRKCRISDPMDLVEVVLKGKDGNHCSTSGKRL